jgi:hypothetical protein
MASAAALAGIQAYGLKWRFEISLHGQPQRLGQEDDLKVGDAAAIRDSIVRDLRGFLAGAGRNLPEHEGRTAIENLIDDLDMCDDDPDDLKAVLTELYDEFDLRRICVVA